MAELLGIITGCITLVDATTKTCMVARMYIHSNRAVAEELTGLLGKFASYKGLIEIIRQQVELDKDDADRLSAIAWVSQPLEWSRRAIENLDVRLGSLPKNEKLGRIFFGKVIDKETAAHLKAFDDTLPLLQLALQSDQRVVSSKILERTTSIGQNVSDVKDLAVQQRDKKDAEEHARTIQKLKDRLNVIDPTVSRHAFLEDKSVAAGRWFLDHDFNSWIEESPCATNKILWLRGRSGMGKTILLSMATHHLQKKIGRTTRDAMAYFYCSSSDQGSQDAVTVLKSFIQQLLDQIPEGDLQKLFEQIPGGEETVIESLKKLVGSRSLSGDTILRWQTALQNLCALFDRVVLFLDALNESDGGDTDRLIGVISLCQTKIPNCQIMVSSTEAVDPLEHFKEFVPRLVEMKQMTVDEGITIFVAEKLERGDRLRSFPPHLKKRIQEEIESKAQGSFRWAECQMQALEGCRLPREVKAALDSMSPTLEDHYLKSLRNIPVGDAPYVQAAIFWLRFLIRPMKIEELREAMTLDTSDPVGPDDRLFDGETESILKRCGSLFSYNARLQSVQLAHDSVRTFLLSEPPQDESVKNYFLQERNRSINHWQLGHTMIKYLKMPCFDESVAEQEYSTGYMNWPFLGYVVDGLQRLMEYDLNARLLPQDERLEEIMLEFASDAYDVYCKAAGEKYREFQYETLTIVDDYDYSTNFE
ncbi:hypothetical protein HDK90DRAFT_461120 [Phyllosticta capitalensis]|uniref:NACHT domain-containing protein n=1 Tax=Phyllosticta capitalensis TaxID=121624 RepID=A0ABR1Z1J8_9PEZI